MLRSCMRGISSEDSASGTYKALQDWNDVLRLLSYSDGVSGYEVLEKAISEFGWHRENDPIDRAVVDAAKTGLQLLIERSCSDGLAGARASKRLYKFLDALKRIDEAREYSRQRFEP